MRRTLFIIIIALLGVTGAWAKETTHTVNNLIYTVVQPGTGENYAILSGYENSPEGILDIPGIIPVYFGVKPLKIPVTMIGEQAFIDREKITEVNIPSTIKSIGNLAFNGCISLTSFNVNSKNANFCSENGILFNKAKTTLLQYPSAKADTDYSIPDGVTKIEDWAFYDCNKLTVMTIPSSVATIGEYALNFCTGLTELFVHATTPPTVGTNAFMNVNLAIPVYVPAASLDAYKAAAGWKDFTNLQALVTEFTVDNLKYKITDYIADEVELTGYATEPTGKLDIPASVTYGSKTYSVTSIVEQAFSGCSALTEVTIPASVTSVGISVFYGCSSLTQATIGDGLTVISQSMFTNCKALEKLVIGKGVTEINNYAFASCYNLKEITVLASNPPSVSSDKVFNYVSRDIPVYVPAESLDAYKAASVWKGFTNLQALVTEFTVDNLKYNVTDLVANTVEITSGYGDGALNIPATVTYAGTEYKVTSIGAEAFYDCSFTSVTIPDGVTIIKYSAFQNCTDLTEVTFGNSITTIENTAFYYCTSLKQVTIPKSVTNIGGNVFGFCTALTHINVDAANTAYSSENGVLFNKDKTTLLRYPVAKPGATYTVPKSVTCIGENAFGQCTALKELTLSENVSKIESYAFEDFAAITKMTVLATVPPTAETSAFKYFNLDTPVHVPAESLAAYQTADGWKEFTNLKAISGTAIDTPSMPESISIQGGTLHNPQGLTVNIYDLTGRLVYSGNATTVELPAGIYVVRCNGASRKVMF